MRKPRDKSDINKVRVWILLGLSVLFFFMKTAPLVQAAAMPPRPDADYVSDQVGYVDERTRAELKRINDGFKEVGIQIVVAVIPSLEGQDLEQYANRLFRAWEIGDAKEDNGLLLLIADEDRKFRIEVGRGLEGAITDGTAGSILRHDMTPAFQAGNYSEGIYDAIRSMAALAAEEYGLDLDELQIPEPGFREEEDLLSAILPLLMLVFLFFIFGRGRRGRLMRDIAVASMMRNRRGGGGRGGFGGFGGGGFGGGGGGGGFSGGGGSSGGGGASGGW